VASFFFFLPSHFISIDQCGLQICAECNWVAQKSMIPESLQSLGTGNGNTNVYYYSLHSVVKIMTVQCSFQLFGR
jgi:hypothetical protein